MTISSFIAAILPTLTMMTLVNKQVPDNEFFRRQVLTSLLTILQIEEEVAKRVARLDMSTQHICELLKSSYARTFRRSKKWGELFTMQSLAA
jgi:hypothetical protein